MIMVVTGSRTYKDQRTVETHLALVHSSHGIKTLITGHCGQGPELWAEDFAKVQGIQTILVPAPWTQGLRAGLDRNGFMLDLAWMLSKPAKPHVMAFARRCMLSPPKCTRPETHITHGTAHCIRAAQEFRFPIKLFKDETLI